MLAGADCDISGDHCRPEAFTPIIDSLKKGGVGLEQCSNLDGVIR